MKRIGEVAAEFSELSNPNDPSSENLISLIHRGGQLVIS